MNGELWGRPADVPWAMIFPSGGPIPRHPSQLYEASLEGIVLFIVLALAIRFGALKRPGLIIGIFAVGYAIARTTSEFFREPDVQLGFLWRGRPWACFCPSRCSWPGSVSFFMPCSIRSCGANDGCAFAARDRD